MFSSLGFDLLEFVAAVAEETSQFLDVAKDGFTKHDTGQSEESSSSSKCRDNGNDSSFFSTANVRTEELYTAADEVERRMNDVRTYLEPLLHREVEIYTIPLHLANQDDCACWEMTVVHEDIHPEDSIEKKEIQEFLENFDISDKTEEIVRVLQEYDETVSIHFREHVPMRVPYVKFWTRFFYRCDEQRVQRELDQTGIEDCDGLSKNHAVKMESALASPSSVLRDTVELDPRSVVKLEESWEKNINAIV